MDPNVVLICCCRYDSILILSHWSHFAKLAFKLTSLVSFVQLLYYVYRISILFVYLKIRPNFELGSRKMCSEVTQKTYCVGNPTAEKHLGGNRV